MCILNALQDGLKNVQWKKMELLGISKKFNVNSVDILTAFAVEH